MTESELAWLNQYHQKVLDVLSPNLEGRELEWLVEQTKPLTK